MEASFTIHASPTGKARPRVTRYGTYTPKKTKQYEDLVKAEWISQCIGIHFGDKALALSLVAFYPIPKSTSKAKRQKMLTGEIRPKVKPDYDNVAKAVCDALNKIAYNDDAQIVDAHVHKYYADIPMVVVTIKEVVQ